MGIGRFVDEYLESLDALANTAVFHFNVAEATG
jgi:hypothetical protein